MEQRQTQMGFKIRNNLAAIATEIKVHEGIFLGGGGGWRDAQS